MFTRWRLFAARRSGTIILRQGRPDHLNNLNLTVTTMAIELASLTLPPSASASDFDPNFGREVKGVNPGELTPQQFKEIETALYTVCHGPSSVPMSLTYSPHSMGSSCFETFLSLQNNSMLSQR